MRRESAEGHYILPVAIPSHSVPLFPFDVRLMHPNELTKLVKPPWADTEAAPISPPKSNPVKTAGMADSTISPDGESRLVGADRARLVGNVVDRRSDGDFERMNANDDGATLQHTELEPLASDESLSESETSLGRLATNEKLGMLPLAVLVFYNVSGGPFGIEATVQSGGNFFALLGFLIFPFIWSLQEALITAELGTALPDAAGGVAWVEEAFGHTAGWMSGYLGWISGATDNAIYPVLFLDYLLSALHEMKKTSIPSFGSCSCP